jgi:hypothetical protein
MGDRMPQQDCKLTSQLIFMVGRSEQGEPRIMKLGAIKHQWMAEKIPFLETEKHHPLEGIS